MMIKAEITKYICTYCLSIWKITPDLKYFRLPLCVWITPEEADAS